MAIPKPSRLVLAAFVLVIVVVLIAVAIAAGVRLPAYHHGPPAPPTIYQCPNGDWNGTRSEMNYTQDTSMLPRVYMWYNPGTDEYETRIGYWIVTDHIYKCPLDGDVIDEYETRISMG